MKKVSVIIILLFATMIFSSSAIAQDDGYRVFGLGVSVMEYGTVYIPINVAPSFRLEPFLGFDFTSYDWDGDADDSRSTVELGIGILPTIRKGSAVIYIGGRIGLAITSGEYKDSGGDVYVESTEASFWIGPVIGGEYYFNPHISLGGEMAISYGSSADETNYTSEFMDDEEDTISGIGTETAIFIRFYF